jgi:hypothetical protein
MTLQQYLDDNLYTFDYGSQEDNALRMVRALLVAYPTAYVIQRLKKVVDAYPEQQQAHRPRRTN